MRIVLVQAAILLAAAGGFRFGLPALARWVSRALDPAVRAWIDRSERAAGPYVHLSRGVSRPERVSLPAAEASLAVGASHPQRAVA